MAKVDRKKQVRFSQYDDLALLREVLAKNPFKNKLKAWVDIASTITESRPHMQVDARRVRERTYLMVDNYKKENAKSLKR